jgi:hypothetical protein
MMVTLYTRDSSGVPRYYTIHDRQGLLFDRYSFTATWGSDASGGGERLFQFQSRREMDRKIRALLRKRLRSGYRVIYTYFRKSDSIGMQAEVKKYASS